MQVRKGSNYIDGIPFIGWIRITSTEPSEYQNSIVNLLKFPNSDQFQEFMKFTSINRSLFITYLVNKVHITVPNNQNSN